MLRRYELTDNEWNCVVDLLSLENTGKQGRPRKDNRTILNGMIWIARSGAPWRDIPERYTAVFKNGSKMVFLTISFVF